MDYKKAEHDCELLAIKLCEKYSLKELQEFNYIAIPRGGFIVLGILSYFLNLTGKNFSPKQDGSRPVVIVDDCSYTGMRFGQIIDNYVSPGIVFAHLYSHPQLRQVITKNEPHVIDCISAYDLKSVSDDGSNYKVNHTMELKQKFEKHQGFRRYWIGIVELVSFAWSEPDFSFRDPASNSLENGWHFTPPQMCLKNRMLMNIPLMPIHIHDYKVPSALVYGNFDGILWLFQTETEKIYIMNDIAADMWRAMAVYGNKDLAIDYLLTQYSIEETRVRRDLDIFITDLCDKGLLEKIVT